jgi:predicted amidophosphoribosyltransferase
MNSVATADQIPLKKLRCQECGTKAEFPASFTEKEASQYCEVCRFHLNHELTYDFRCPVCVARLWHSRLQAVRILLLHRAVLRSEEVR